MIYAALAHGELRCHILGQAREYLDAAVAVGVAPTSGLLFLKGRILLAQGAAEPAAQAIQQSVDLGQPRISALPYLAEIAFQQRDFGRVRQIMQQLADLNPASKTRAIVDLWTARDNVRNLSDRRHLPHL